MLYVDKKMGSCVPSTETTTPDHAIYSSLKCYQQHSTTNILEMKAAIENGPTSSI